MKLKSFIDLAEARFWVLWVRILYALLITGEAVNAWRFPLGVAFLQWGDKEVQSVLRRLKEIRRDHA